MPRAVVPVLLEPLIASFCHAYPEIELELVSSAELVDLAAEEQVDGEIRFGVWSDGVFFHLGDPGYDD